MNIVIGGSLESVYLAIRRYIDLYGRSHVEKLPVMESRVLDELKEYNQKLESIKLENRKLYISSVKSDDQKQETDGIGEIDSNQKQETDKTEEIDSNQKIETNKTERRKSIVERMKEGEDDPNDFWYNPTHEDLSLKPQDVKVIEGMLAFRDRLAKLSDSTPLDFSDMVCIGDGESKEDKSDCEDEESEATRGIDDEEEKEDGLPNWGDNDDESGENESDDESDFDDGWGELDSESYEGSEELEELGRLDDGSDEKESEENAVDDEDDSDTWGSSEDDSDDDMNDGWGSDDSDDSDSTDENTGKEEENGESGSYDWNDMDSWDSEDSDDEDDGGETQGNEEGEESEDTNEATESDNDTEVDTYNDVQGSWDLDGWSDDSEDDDTEVRVEKSEDDVKKDLKKVFGISLKTDKKEEKDPRREDTKEEKEVKPRREVIKEEKVAKPRREDIGDVDDYFWNDESSEKDVQKSDVVIKKKEAPVSYDTSSLRGFVKSHKGCKCTIEEALQYFKKADIEKDLRMGRVFKGKKSLFI